MKRRLRRISAATAAILALAPLSEALAADTPAAPAYKQTKQCIGAVPPVPSVSDGVSWAQQQLLYTNLWQYSRGEGVKVGVIDTGVNPGKAFGSRLKGIGDLVHKSSGAPGLSDCDGHGTLVAGLIGGHVDRASGFSGVAPASTILSIRQNSLAFGPTDSSRGSGTGEQTAGTEGTLARAITMAVNAGATVINISAADCGAASNTTAPELAAAVRNAVARNVVVVVAAGNLGSTDVCKTQNTPGAPLVTRASPADVPAALTVGSTGKNGAPSSFSVAGPWVDVAAPGEQIVSVNPHPNSKGEVNKVIGAQGDSSIQGTSFSAPYVAGLAALIRSRYPKLNAREVIRRIVLTSGPAAGTDGDSYAEGAGPIDPLRALTAVIPGESGGTMPPQPAVHEVTEPTPAPVDRQRQIALWGSGITAGTMAAVGLAFLVRRSRAGRRSTTPVPPR